MFLEMQDKRLGPKRAKLLSAHLFFWPTFIRSWAKQSARLLIMPKKRAGPKGIFKLNC